MRKSYILYMILALCILSSQALADLAQDSARAWSEEVSGVLSPKSEWPGIAALTEKIFRQKFEELIKNKPGENKPK